MGSKEHPPKARENAACSKHRHQLSGWEAEVQPVPGQEAGCGGRGGGGIQSLVLPKGRGDSPRDGAASLKNYISSGGDLLFILKTSLNSCGIPLSLHFTL